MEGGREGKASAYFLEEILGLLKDQTIYPLKNSTFSGRRDGSVGKNACTGPELESQHAHEKIWVSARQWWCKPLSL